MWEVADLCGALMVLFNVIALFALAKYVRYVLSDYMTKRRQGVPALWDYDMDIVEVY